MFVQVLLISLLNVSFAFLYIYMQYFPVAPWMAMFASYAWASSQGAFQAHQTHFIEFYYRLYPGYLHHAKQEHSPEHEGKIRRSCFHPFPLTPC